MRTSRRRRLELLTHGAISVAAKWFAHSLWRLRPCRFVQHQSDLSIHHALLSVIHHTGLGHRRTLLNHQRGGHRTSLTSLIRQRFPSRVTQYRGGYRRGLSSRHHIHLSPNSWIRTIPIHPDAGGSRNRFRMIARFHSFPGSQSRSRYHCPIPTSSVHQRRLIAGSAIRGRRARTGTSINYNSRCIASATAAWRGDAVEPCRATSWLSVVTRRSSASRFGSRYVKSATAASPTATPRTNMH